VIGQDPGAFVKPTIYCWVKSMARQDFAIILDELDFVKMQVSWLPTRTWLSRMWLIGFGSVWALLAVGALMPAW
jgi:hypothetical protein